MKQSPANSAEPEDHCPESNADFRVRAARQKRERMRQRLLSATLDVYQVDEKGGLAVIDDVVKKAGVARGTFYKYFDSLDAAVTELGQQMADEIIVTFNHIFSGVDDEGIRAVAGPLLALAHAAMEPRWAAFTSRVDYIDYFSQHNLLQSTVTKSLLRAKHAGVLTFASLDAATDLVIGAVVEGARRLAHRQQCNADYVKELSVMTAAALGMDKPAAELAVQGAWDYMAENARLLPWWHHLEGVRDKYPEGSPQA